MHQRTSCQLIWILAKGKIVEEEPERQIWSAPKIFHSTSNHWEQTLRCAEETLLVAVPRRSLDEGTACELASSTSTSPTKIKSHTTWSHDIAITTDWIQQEKPNNMLEVGSGKGFYSRFLAGQVSRLVLSDPNKEALELAQDLLSWASPTTGVETICCEGEALPVSNQSFDVVVSRWRCIT